MRILYHHRIRSKDGQYVHLEEMIASFRKLGHDVRLVGPSAVESEEFGAEGGWIDHLKRILPAWVYEIFEFAYNGLAFVRIYHAAQRYRPDFIYERYNLFLCCGIWTKKLLKVPLALEVNAPLFHERDKNHGIGLKRFAKWSENYAWRNADLTLPVTDVLAGHLRSTGVDPERILVVPNGVNLSRIKAAPTRDLAKAKLGLEDRLVVGFVGFMREWHGLGHILSILEDPEVASEKLHVLLVGDGPARQSLQEKVRTRNLADRVTITGVVTRDQVFDYIGAFDIAVQPAVVPYASPLKLFEYLALGCAIVAPRMANICEILVDGRNALLFAPDSEAEFRHAILRACRDPHLRHLISAGAKQAIHHQNLTWDANADLVVKSLAALGGGSIHRQSRSAADDAN